MPSPSTKRRRIGCQQSRKLSHHNKVLGIRDLLASISQFIDVREHMRTWTLVCHDWNQLHVLEPWCLHTLESFKLLDLSVIPRRVQSKVRYLCLLWVPDDKIAHLLGSFTSCTDLELLHCNIAVSQRMKSIKRIVVHCSPLLREYSVPASTVESVTFCMYYNVYSDEVDVMEKLWSPNVTQIRLFAGTRRASFIRHMFRNLVTRSHPLPKAILERLRARFKSVVYVPPEFSVH